LLINSEIEHNHFGRWKDFFWNSTYATVWDCVRTANASTIAASATAQIFVCMADESMAAANVMAHRFAHTANASIIAANVVDQRFARMADEGPLAAHARPRARQMHVDQFTKRTHIDRQAQAANIFETQASPRSRPIHRRPKAGPPNNTALHATTTPPPASKA
jgi:hypothetical protein